MRMLRTAEATRAARADARQAVEDAELERKLAVLEAERVIDANRNTNEDE